MVGGILTLTRLDGGCPCVLLAPLVLADLLLDLSSLSSSDRNSRLGYGIVPPSNTLWDKITQHAIDIYVKHSGENTKRSSARIHE